MMETTERAKVIGVIVYCSQQDGNNVRYFKRCLDVEAMELAGLLWSPPGDTLEARDTVLGSFYEHNAARFRREGGECDPRARGYKYVEDMWCNELQYDCWVGVDENEFTSLSCECDEAKVKTRPQGKTMMLYKGKDCFSNSDKR